MPRVPPSGPFEGAAAPGAGRDRPMADRHPVSGACRGPYGAEGGRADRGAPVRFEAVRHRRPPPRVPPPCTRARRAAAGVAGRLGDGAAALRRAGCCGRPGSAWPADAARRPDRGRFAPGGSLRAGSLGVGSLGDGPFGVS
ncbi:hypothetical protein GCM10010129_36910 [Streptomyces fumigatiscleroticus]|nr:hypothetical protein GCM10010129_36910 [Streptomyces fumigatiscleroticus]